MKIRPLVLLLALALPAPLFAQVAPPPPDTAAAAEPPEAPPPAGLADAELGRSRRCVPTLARLDTLNTKLAPIGARVERLRALYDAVTREDSTRARPFDQKDPVEKAVAQWFASDLALATRYAATGDSAIDARRAQGRDQITKRLEATADSANARAQDAMKATGELENQVLECEDVILVRPAVLEQCPPALTTAVCEAARTDSISPLYHFVNDPMELWDIESSVLWTQPTRLDASPTGGLQGGETSALERRGNLLFGLGVRIVAQDRSRLTPEQLAPLQADLDSIGFTYQNPRFILSPALTVQFRVADPIANENFYFVHFGDLSQPARDVIWSGPVTSGPIQVLVPAKKAVLDRLAAGETVTLTAVRFPDPNSKQADAVYTMELPSLRQADAVATMLEYITGGQLEADFTAIAPTEAPPAAAPEPAPAPAQPPPAGG